MSQTWHGWWSDRMLDVVRRTSIYSNPGGHEIEVCFVTKTAEHDFVWPDIQYLGKVTHWLRDGRRLPQSATPMPPIKCPRQFLGD